MFLSINQAKPIKTTPPPRKHMHASGCSDYVADVVKWMMQYEQRRENHRYPRVHCSPAEVSRVAQQVSQHVSHRVSHTAQQIAEQVARQVAEKTAQQVARQVAADVAAQVGSAAGAKAADTATFSNVGGLQTLAKTLAEQQLQLDATVQQIRFETDSNTDLLRGCSNWNFASNAAVFTFLSLDGTTAKTRLLLESFQQR